MRGRVLALLALLSIAPPGCKRGGAEATIAAEEAKPVVREDSQGLIFTWIDERGEFRVELLVSQVPKEHREAVRVQDPAHEAPDGAVFVADLRAPGPDGAYPVVQRPRAAFEAIAEERRKVVRAEAAKSAEPAAPNAGAAPTTSAPSGRGVIVYGASWCGACAKAREHLRARRVPFVDKDIDEDSSAAREMRAKLAKAGMRGSGIPVIDVHGKLLMGFDPGMLDRALASR